MRKKLTIGLVSLALALGIAIPAAAHGESHDGCSKTSHARTTTGSPAGWSHSKSWGSGILPFTYDVLTNSYYATQSGGWNYSHTHSRFCIG